MRIFCLTNFSGLFCAKVKERIGFRLRFGLGAGENIRSTTVPSKIEGVCETERKNSPNHALSCLLKFCINKLNRCLEK